MRWTKTLRLRLRSLLRRQRVEQEIDEELRYHVDRQVDEFVARGMSREEARSAALRTMGGLAQRREECRDALGLRLLDEGRQDVRYAVRILRRSPVFTGTAVLSLAIGIGATTLVFSVVNALVLRPFAIVDPERMVFVQREGSSTNYYPHSFAHYQDLRNRNATFDDMAAYGFGFVGLDTGAGPVRTYRRSVTGNYFAMLGIQPSLGRLIGPDDDRPGALPTAVLSWDFWHSAFNASPSVLGTTVRVNQRPHAVIGVAPRGFHGLEVTSRVPLWTPVQVDLPEGVLNDRASGSVFVVGRMRRGVSRAAADANLGAITRDLSRTYPNTDAQYRVRITEPGWLGDGFRKPIQAFALAVLLLGLLVLLTTCANLATMLTARTVDRHREVAIRMSLGAGRARVVRQLTLETLLVTIAGGVGALSLTAMGANLLSNWWLPIEIPTQVDVRPDGRVFLFAGAISVFACLICTIAPGRLLTRLQPNAALRGVGGFLQVLFCSVLVAACLLSIIGFRRSLSLPLGFDATGLSTVRLEFGTVSYSPEQRAQLSERAVEAFRRLPGVESAAYANGTPMMPDPPFRKVYVEGAMETTERALPMTAVFEVSPDLFRTMRIGLLEGLAFDARETSNAPLMAVVNDAFVRQILRSSHPVGQRFRLHTMSGRLWQVVGVVADGKYQWLTEPPRPAAFFPLAQTGLGSVTFVVRGTTAGQDLVPAIRRVITDLDHGLPVSNAGRFDRLMDLAFFPIRIAAITLTAFGTIAVVLALNGMYGVVAYAVARRRREIALRLALGADVANVLRLVLGRMAFMVATSLAVGLAIALALSRVLGQVVYLASPRDPVVLASVTLVMTAATVLATLGPAAQALHIPPALALRSE